MQVTNEQLRSYQESGFVFIPNCFSQTEINLMKNELPTLYAQDSAGRVLEKDGNIVRAIHGSYNINEVFWRLSRHPRILEPAMQFLRDQVYVYQFKINAKAAFSGDKWEWHQDFIFWLNEDGMPSPRAVNVFVFINEVNEFNAPMFFIPGSHKEGLIAVEPKKHQANDHESQASWISSFTADLKYSLDREIVSTLVARYGIVALKGPPGSVIFSHPNLVHASAANISPFDRPLAIITYNSLKNIPRSIENRRPEFLVSRDYRPLVPSSDNTLLLLAQNHLQES